MADIEVPFSAEEGCDISVKELYHRLKEFRQRNPRVQAIPITLSFLNVDTKLVALQIVGVQHREDTRVRPPSPRQLVDEEQRSLYLNQLGQYMKKQLEHLHVVPLSGFWERLYQYLHQQRYDDFWLTASERVNLNQAMRLVSDHLAEEALAEIVIKEKQVHAAFNRACRQARSITITEDDETQSASSKAQSVSLCPGRTLSLCSYVTLSDDM